MEGRGQDLNSHSEPVRSRWTPKPEQIVILESIFNSGMVNPPKDETVRIRKLLEKFGAVGDANVFYWFQNRRSRSRRRQRQMQATLAGANGGGCHSNSSSSSQLIMNSAMIHNIGGSSSCSGGYAQPLVSADSGSSYHNHHESQNDYHVMMAGSSSTIYGGELGIGHEVADDNFFPVQTTHPMSCGYTKSDTNSIFCQSDNSNYLNYSSGKLFHTQSVSPCIIVCIFVEQFSFYFFSEIQYSLNSLLCSVKWL